MNKRDVVWFNKNWQSWFYAGPYVPSGVVYGYSEWCSFSVWLVPGFDPDPPINKMDLYS